MDKATEEIIAKQSAEQAVPVTGPIKVNEIVKEVRESAKEKENIAQKEAKILSEGVDSDFWRLIKAKLNARIQSMRNAASARLGAGPIDLADVGLRSLIINEVADSFQDLINLVELSNKKVTIESQEEDLPETVNEVMEVSETEKEGEK